MPMVRRFRCILDLEDTFSGWGEDSPQLIKDYSFWSPFLGDHASFQSSNLPLDMVLKLLLKLLAKAFNILWHFRIPGHPQSSGNETITLSKTFLSNSPKSFIQIGLSRIHAGLERWLSG